MNGAPDKQPTETRLLNGRYRLVGKLGDGGMGSVWLADDTLLDRSVALKALIQGPGAGQLAERRVRALQEARALAKVRHPAIVAIHDVFFIDDNPWIVMEYIQGRALQDIIKEQVLDEQSVARISLQVLRGLMAVHRAGVVHRDVKPANILVADGSVFLVDFGIARIAGDTSLTGQAIVGTPDFLAPERFKAGYQVGAPADIWALGVTIFCALEGSSPFWRDSERGWEATMIAIISEPPRSMSRPGRLADITLRMLHKDPGQRADAHQVLAVLEQIIAGHPAVPVSRIKVPSQTPIVQPPAPGRGPNGWDSTTAALGSSPDREPRSPVREPRPPARKRGTESGPRPGMSGQGKHFSHARELIRNVGIDTGAAMLLAMPEDEAARILAESPPRLCGELLQGIAAAQPGTAVAILRQLRSTAAGRAFAYFRPELAAAVVDAMTSGDALRILNNTDERTAASVITELPAATSTALLKSMHSRQRAAEVLTHVRPAIAAEILRADGGFAAAVLSHLSEPVRKQVSRHLVTGVDQPG